VTLPTPVSLIPVAVPKEIIPGDDLAKIFLLALRKQKLSLKHGDMLVFKHKIVSKAEGQVVPLHLVAPSAAAKKWSKKSRTDARIVELALRESRCVIRQRVVGGHGVLITETRGGLVCANSGVDLSNVSGECTLFCCPKMLINLPDDFALPSNVGQVSQWP
jgi:coenzyme F420-0:L-glutamate ligase / coenzyme F420-1:gamma-L-glutamate ligase